MTTFVERKRREYDIVKLHALYLKNVNRKESVRISKELREKRELLSKTVNQHLKRKMKTEIQELEKASEGDFHTLYLLDSIPILNEFHRCNVQLEAAKRKNDRDAISNHTRQRQIIVVDYLRRFYPELNKDEQVDRTSAFRETKELKHCGVACLQQEDCSVVCPKCGFVVMDSSTVDMANPSRNLSYNRNVSAASSFSYKRVNHLRELLRQFQGRTTSTVPDEAVEKVFSELDKLTLPRNKINSFTIRKILKKLRYHRYYDNTVSLTIRINPEYQPIRLTPEYEERLIFQFIQLEKPFEEVRDKFAKSRNNFLSYPYLFYRLNELNSRQDLNRDVRLLKSVQLVNRQDFLWKKLTEKLGWPYKGRTTRI